MDLELKNKSVIVTGGGSNIGRAIVLAFAGEGAHITIGDVDTAQADKTAEFATKLGAASVQVIKTDVTSLEQVQAMFKAATDKHGRVDVLVNNVGDYRPLMAFEESTPDTWQRMYDINLRHVFAVTRAFLPAMIAAHSGSIVNIHSVEGMRGFPRDPVYGAMKAAVAHFTTCLAVDVGRYGVRVNGIGTDLTQTPQVDYLTGYSDAEHLWQSWAPVGRVGRPADQARVALFLASDQSAFVTGHNIPVDGGTKAGGGWMFSPRAGRFVNRSKHL